MGRRQPPYRPEATQNGNVHNAAAPRNKASPAQVVSGFSISST